MEYMCGSCNTYKPKEFFKSMNGTITTKCKRCLKKYNEVGYSVNYDKRIMTKIKNRTT